MAGLGDRSAKDKAMAANLKAKGVKRTTKLCPMTHKPIPLHQPVAKHG